MKNKQWKISILNTNQHSESNLYSKFKTASNTFVHKLTTVTHEAISDQNDRNSKLNSCYNRCRLGIVLQ